MAPLLLLLGCGEGIGTVGTEDAMGDVELSLSAPTNLEVTEASSAAIALKWNAGSKDTRAYVIWRGDAEYSNWVSIARVSSSTRSHRDTQVVAGAIYTYGVRALDRSGKASASSNLVRATAGAASSPAPTPEPTPEPAPAPAPEASTFERPFATAAWLYQPIPATVQLDPDSAAMVQSIRSGTPIANVHEFGIPFYSADASTQLKAVNCLENWGECGLEKYGPRPLTQSMVPHVGSDGAMVVVDVSPRTSSMRGRAIDEYWQYSWNGGSPTTSWGGVIDLDGEGRVGGATGAGFSRAAGVVRAFEIEQGRIDHALVFSTRFCEVNVVRYPASKTDGKYSGTGAIPEGARIQLDPSLNPDAYSLSKAERAVFVALQKYGAYNMDCGAATAAFSFEDVPGNPGTVYTNAGIGWDYYGLGKIPWDRIRVLKSWNGQ